MGMPSGKNARDFLEMQRYDIQRLRVFIEDASGNDNKVSEQSVLSYIKNILNREDPEGYLDFLKEEGIVTDFGHGRIGFTGNERHGECQVSRKGEMREPL